MAKEAVTPEFEAGEQGEIELKVDVQNITGDVDDQGAAAGGEFDQFSQTQRAEEPVISEEMAALILQFPFDLAAGVWGDFWKLRPAEVDLMKVPGAKVFSDIFGQWAGKYPEAYMLGIALIVAAAPRAAMTAKIKQERKKPKTYKPEEVGEQLDVE